MKTHQTGPVRQNGALTLLVLVPHRDARLPLRNWSGALFAAGFPGAWSFPWAAPLAILSRPLNAGELKRRAGALREQSLADGRDGKIKTGPAARAVFPGGCLCGEAGDAAIFGPILDIPAESFSSDESEKIIHRFSPFILGASLMRGSGPEKNAALPPPEFSFRAAALANMIYRPLSMGNSGAPESGYSFEWKIGKLYWLPPVKKSRGRSEPAGGGE